MAVVAVDCGGTNLAYGRARSPASVRVAGVVPTPRRASAIPAAVAAAVANLVDGSVTALGVGSAGLVDHSTGTLVWSPHSSGRRVALGPELARALGRPVVVDNDANLAGLAEARLGAGVGHHMMLLIALGTGIGGSLVIDGAVERGRGFLGEIGHMVLEPGGPACLCGRRGCWEALVSGTSLGRAAVALAAADPAGAVARAAGGAKPRGEHLSAAARQRDPAARAALAAAGEWLGRGLANLVMALDPDVIVLGGGAAAAGRALLGPARAAMTAAIGGSGYRGATPVVAARFGSRAGLVGAALAAEEAT